MRFSDDEQHLRQLRRQYFALYPIRFIEFQPYSSLFRHQDWIYEHVLSAPYQPAKDYERKFLKKLIEVVEDGLRSDDALADEWELDDRLVDYYSELLVESGVSTTVPVPEPSFKTYLYDHGEKEQSITLFEAQTTIEDGSTGLRTWTASLFLAEALLDRPDLLLRSSASTESTLASAGIPPILELGAGTGFLSIFLGQIGCSKIWSSDVGDGESDDQEIRPEEVEDDIRRAEQRLLKMVSGTRRRGPLDGLTANLELNRKKFSGEINPCRLDWFHSLDRPGNEEKRINMIRMSQDLPDDLTLVATDVIYDPDLIEPLVSTIDLFLTHPSPDAASSSRSALLAATVRNESTLQRFRDVCSTTHLTLDALDITRASVPSVFWNANTWEGSEVVVFRITSNLNDSGQ